MNEQILATVTDEEAERFLELKKNSARVIELAEEAERLSVETQKQRRIWFHKMIEKYDLPEGAKIHYDYETKTISMAKKSDKEELLLKIIETLAGLKDE